MQNFIKPTLSSFLLFLGNQIPIPDFPYISLTFPLVYIKNSSPDLRNKDLEKTFGYKIIREKFKRRSKSKLENKSCDFNDFSHGLNVFFRLKRALFTFYFIFLYIFFSSFFFILLPFYNRVASFCFSFFFLILHFGRR